MITFQLDNQATTLAEPQVALYKQLKANELHVIRWLHQVAATYDCTIGNLNYILCTNEKELAVNQQFLQHDYYTDVITFDYTVANILAGDIFISLEFITQNAEELSIAPYQELLRILAHGLLHLTGQADKTPETKAQMTAKENHALALISQPIQNANPQSTQNGENQA